jgi:hypothetical protein
MISKIKISLINYVSVAFQAIIIIALISPIAYSCKAETVGFIENCTNNKCLSKPNNITVSSDGNHLLTIDSSENPYIRKIKITAGGFTEDGIIPLNISNTNSTEFEIDISEDNKKALVYGKPDGQSGILIIVDLVTNTTKSLNCLNSDSPLPNSIAFIDSEGKKIIAGNSNASQGKLFIVNTVNDQIEKTINIKDTPNSVKVSPKYKHAIITYRGINNQTATVYDLETEGSKDFETPPDIFFLVHNFLFSNSFNLLGTKTVISSIGGNHVLHLLDLKNKKMIVKILNPNSDGLTLSAIYPDGSTVISAGINNTNPVTIKVYKTDVSNPLSPSILKTITINDSTSIIDLDISTDQQKLFILTLKNSNKVLKVFSLKDLTLINEYTVSANKLNTKLIISPDSKYGAIPLPKSNSN